MVEVLKDRSVAKLLTFMVNPGTIDARGASGTNIDFERGEAKWVNRFDAADQRHCWQAVARGIAEDSTEYLQSGLNAIDYAFRHQEEGGNLGKSRWFETMGFLESALRCYALLADSRYREEYLPRLDRHKPSFRRAMNWLNATRDKEFKPDWDAAADHINVVAATAVTYLLAGQILEDESLCTQSRGAIEIALSKQQENGVFPESGGFDSSYQAVSLWHLTIYWFHSKDPSLNQRLHAALKKGWEWEKSRISPRGEILTEGNSRTGPQGETWRGVRKEPNYPEVCMALLTWARLGQDPESEALARKVFEYGRQLHREKKRKP